MIRIEGIPAIGRRLRARPEPTGESAAAQSRRRRRQEIFSRHHCRPRLGSLLFGITTGDPITFIAMGTLLTVVALALGILAPGGRPGLIRWL